jgi:uncharacterized protein YndB with AHSA1/START domain
MASSMTPLDAVMNTLQVTTPSATEIVMTRTFDAPRQLVFDAFTRPELLRRWLGRQGDEMTVCDVDLRVGGAYRYVFHLRPDEQGRRDTFRETGTFREIDPPQRVVCTESFDDYPGETVVSTIFVEQEGRTTTTATCMYESREVRDAIIASGVESGAGESYDRLAELLSSQQ